jgi:hypothetical protein
MSQERTFTLNLKNDQQIVLKFTPIATTGNQLWQMFATTESLNTVQQLTDMDGPSTITAPPIKNKSSKKK